MDDFARKALGPIQHVELPKMGETVARDEPLDDWAAFERTFLRLTPAEQPILP